MTRIPVSIITGFLGSGKTTLLNRLLSRPDMSDIAVIINEFGEIGLDHQLVESADDTIVQLTNGCLCCTIRGDLVDTLRDLYYRRGAGLVPRFAKLLIETTGLADPAPVIQVVLSDPMVNHCYQLDGLVTTVDAVLGAATLNAHEEAVRQVAVADRIVLTKTDLLAGGKNDTSGGSLGDLKSRLAALNPAAPQITAVRGDLDAVSLFGAGLYDPASKNPDVRSWLRAEAYIGADGHQHHDVNRHDAHIRAYCVTRDAPFSLRGLEMFLEAVAGEVGDNLLRLKGIVHVAERPEGPAVIQGVQNIFHNIEWLTRWPGGDRTSRIVLITKDFEHSNIEEILALIDRMTGAKTQSAIPESGNQTV